MEAWKQYKYDFLLFVECGFIAVNQADETAAINLFKAAELLDKDSVMPKIGVGYLHLHKLELNKAIKAFKDVLKKEANNEMAKAFLGIVMSMTSDDWSEGEKILINTKKSNNKDIQKLSSTALDFVDKFVKKHPTPVEGTMGKKAKNMEKKERK